MKNTVNKTNVTKNLTSSFDLFKPSYEAILLNINAFIVVILLPTLYFLFISGITNRMISPETGVVSSQDLSTILPLFAFGFLISFVVAPIVPYVQLKSADGKTVAINEAFKKGMRYFWRYWGLSILVSFMIVGGLLLFIVPGLIFIRRYYLAAYYLYDRNLTIKDAMKTSAEETKPVSGYIWSLIGVLILLYATEVLPYVGNIFGVVLPLLYVCAPAIRYREITNYHKNRKKSGQSARANSHVKT